MSIYSLNALLMLVAVILRYYQSMCVCVHERAHSHSCMRACMCVCVHECARWRACMRACLRVRAKEVVQAVQYGSVVY